MLLAVLLGHWLGSPAFGRFRWTLPGVMAGIAATVPLLFLLRWCLRTRWPPMVRLVALVEERLGPLVAGASVPELALAALLAGVGEEALFRGVAQSALADRIPTWGAVLAASALFGAAHWITPAYAALATVIGGYLGVLYLSFDNLLVPILTHALYDLVALFILAHLKPAPVGSVV